MSIVVAPEVEVLYNGLILALKPLPVCQSVKCKDAKKGTAGMLGMLTGGWEFTWHPIQHGIGACVRCGAWHQLYHYPELRAYTARCTGEALCLFSVNGAHDEVLTKLHEHQSTTGHVGYVMRADPPEVRAVIIDSRPEHYADGKVPEAVST